MATSVACSVVLSGPLFELEKEVALFMLNVSDCVEGGVSVVLSLSTGWFPGIMIRSPILWGQSSKESMCGPCGSGTVVCKS